MDPTPDGRNADNRDTGTTMNGESSIPLGSSNEGRVNLVGGSQILVNPRQRSDIMDSRDLVELARQLQTADQFTKANVTNKLTVIVDQIRYLQEQARKILQEANQAQDLHHVSCNFKKIPGNIYYLYRKQPANQRLFSMLSPQEWGATCPYTFLGAFKLQYDMSWTPTDKLPEKDQDLQLINRILEASQNKTHDPFAFSITDISNEHNT